MTHDQEVYIVTKEVWQATGLEGWGGCLCTGCLEKRIGRGGSGFHRLHRHGKATRGRALRRWCVWSSPKGGAAKTHVRSLARARCVGRDFDRRGIGAVSVPASHPLP